MSQYSVLKTNSKDKSIETAKKLNPSVGDIDIYYEIHNYYLDFRTKPTCSKVFKPEFTLGATT